MCLWYDLIFIFSWILKLDLKLIHDSIVLLLVLPFQIVFIADLQLTNGSYLVLISSHDCNNSSQSLQRISLLIWNKYKVKYHILLTQLLIRNEWNFWGKNPFFLVFLSFCTIIHIDICKDKMMKNITTSVTQGHDMHII